MLKYYIDMSEESKDNVIRGVSYDTDGGFGSINETYKATHHIINTITIHKVKDGLNRQKPRQTKAYSGLSSYVAKKVCKSYR